MKATTPRQRAIHKALRELVPLVPYSDFQLIAQAARSKHMRTLAPVDSAYLATIAHIRHQHTEYDGLRDDGYDHDSARHFVLEDINQVLEEWGCIRRLSFDVEDES